MKKAYRLWHNLHLAVALIMLVGIGYTALLYYITDSEFWAITLAKEIFNPKTDQTGLYYKLPFYFYIHIAHLFAKKNVDVILYSRALFAIVSWVVIYLTYQVAQQITKSRQFAFYAILILGMTTYYFVHSTQIRSDIFSCAFFMAAWLVILKIKEQKWQLTRTRLIVYSIAVFLMALSTPKSIFFTLILAAILFYERSVTKTRSTQSPAEALRTLLIALLAPWGLLLVALIVSHLGDHTNISNSYEAALNLFQNNFLFGLDDFFTLQIFAKFNWEFLILLFTALAWAIYEITKRAPKRYHDDQALQIAVGLAFVFILAHSLRLQFFIASFLPLFSIFCARFLQKMPRQFHFTRKWYYTVLILALGKFYFSIDFVRNNFANPTQLVVIQDIESYLEQYPHAHYYDTIGALPLRHQDYAFISPYDGFYEFHANKIKLRKPDFILYTARLALIKNTIDPFLQDSYIQIATDIWARQSPLINPREVTVKEKTYQAYNLVDIFTSIFNSNSNSEALYVYENRGKHQTPIIMTVYDKIHKTIKNYPSGLLFSTFAAQELIPKNRELGEFELLLEPNKQKVSGFAPIQLLEVYGGLKTLFAYKSYF